MRKQTYIVLIVLAFGCTQKEELTFADMQGDWWLKKHKIGHCGMASKHDIMKQSYIDFSIENRFIEIIDGYGNSTKGVCVIDADSLFIVNENTTYVKESYQFKQLAKDVLVLKHDGFSDTLYRMKEGIIDLNIEERMRANLGEDYAPDPLNKHHTKNPQ